MLCDDTLHGFGGVTWFSFWVSFFFFLPRDIYLLESYHMIAMISFGSACPSLEAL